MKILRAILIILIIAALAAVAYWYFTSQSNAPLNSALTGSGTVETTEVILSPEVSGRIVEIAVSEGDAVKTGVTLFRLDDALLNAQRNQAQANLSAAQAGLDAANTGLAAAQAAVTTAQSQYNLALANARIQAQPSRVAAWSQTEPSEFAQPVWYFTHTEEISASQNEMGAASDALAVAKASLDEIMSSSNYANLTSVENRLAQARTAFLNATDVLDRANAQNDSDLRDVAQQAYDAAKSELDTAQNAYTELLTTQQAKDILDLRAHLAVAQARHDDAVDRYNALLTGEDSLSVKVAADSVLQAQANVTAAKSKVTQAQKAIDQAQAALDLVSVQLDKLVITAPSDGVVLTRNIEPGELVLAGATALTLGRLNTLTITVYLPENHYGEVKLGDKASVSVDSFPTELFFATVTRIANQAEFTPRNVQTVEGRQTTVFAIKLSIDNPAGLLKPGMPADVTFIK
ncbi:MAG TPA: efflux RND transporter periplasmic adaptor subunit [Anaerolineales bacterium]|nr:efflux RND transporter periplasmic adaptor subunit [Anaerolineales bacterium]